MSATELLDAYVKAHNAGVRSWDYAALAALFADDAELAFVGKSVGPHKGKAAIERAFRQHGPDDVLVPGVIVRSGRGRAAARYSWGAKPDVVAGTLRLTERDGKIAALVVRVGSCDLEEPKLRDAVRGVVHTSEGDVLLVRVISKDGAFWWITPGGGVDPGESDEAALRRELAEEAGVVDAKIGPCVWTRDQTYEWDTRVFRQTERFFQVRVPRRFEPLPTFDAAALRAESLDGIRWWTPEQMLEAGDVFGPRRLPGLVASLVKHGAPGVPTEAGE